MQHKTQIRTVAKHYLEKKVLHKSLLDNALHTNNCNIQIYFIHNYKTIHTLITLLPKLRNINQLQYYAHITHITKLLRYKYVV